MDFSTAVKDDTVVETPTAPEFYPYPTTTPYYTYSYCYPGNNGTARGWNATAICTGVYTGPLYTGNGATRREGECSWIMSVLLFIAGVGFL